MFKKKLFQRVLNALFHFANMGEAMKRMTLRFHSMLILFAVLLIAAPRSVRMQRNVEAFGSGSLTKPFDVKVGKARSDSLNRVYVSERNGDLYRKRMEQHAGCGRC